MLDIIKKNLFLYTVEKLTTVFPLISATPQLSAVP